MFAPGFYPVLFFTLRAVAYLLMLPAIASLHVRHKVVRDSAAILGSLTGTSAVVLGFGAATLPPFLPAAAISLAMWWWTIGKMWVETAVLPRVLGWITLSLGVAALLSAASYAVTSQEGLIADIPMHVALALWLGALALVFWRAPRSMTS